MDDPEDPRSLEDLAARLRSLRSRENVETGRAPRNEAGAGGGVGAGMGLGFRITVEIVAGVAVGGVPSIAEFGKVLPSLIPAVGNRYLGHAAAYPPDGSVVEKPSLHGFMPTNSLERAGA